LYAQKYEKLSALKPVKQDRKLCPVRRLRREAGFSRKGNENSTKKNAKPLKNSKNPFHCLRRGSVPETLPGGRENIPIPFPDIAKTLPEFS
jgi:hypothetical protein